MKIAGNMTKMAPILNHVLMWMWGSIEMAALETVSIRGMIAVYVTPGMWKPSTFTHAINNYIILGRLNFTIFAF